MDLGLRDRVALITGGSAGIGLATARLLVAEGARVAICARGAERLAAAVAELRALPGAQVFARPCDVLDPAQVQAFVTATVAELGGLDVLVCNAGRSRMQRFQETTDAEWREELELKFFGLLHPLRAALPHLQASGQGAVVVVNAVLARQPEPHLAATSAARAGLLNLTRTLATELAPRVRVNSVLLGTIESEQWHRRYREAQPGVPEEAWFAQLAAERRIPLGRFGKPEEVAAAIAFLASRQASYITGATLDVAGGVQRYM